jgi:hypothetical protein
MESLLNKLTEGFDRYKIPYIITADVENVISVIKFIGADDSDCFLLFAVIGNEIRVYQLIGTTITKRLFDYKDISDDFFMIIKFHYKTVRRCADPSRQMRACLQIVSLSLILFALTWTMVTNLAEAVSLMCG